MATNCKDFISNNGEDEVIGLCTPLSQSEESCAPMQAVSDGTSQFASMPFGKYTSAEVLQMWTEISERLKQCEEKVRPLYEGLLNDVEARFNEQLQRLNQENMISVEQRDEAMRSLVRTEMKVIIDMCSKICASVEKMGSPTLVPDQKEHHSPENTDYKGTRNKLAEDVADNEISVHLPHVMLLSVTNHQIVSVKQPACAFVVDETDYQMATKLLNSRDLAYSPYFVGVKMPSKDKGEVTGTTYRLESVNKDDDVRIPSGASVGDHYKRGTAASVYAEATLDAKPLSEGWSKMKDGADMAELNEVVHSKVIPEVNKKHEELPSLWSQKDPDEILLVKVQLLWDMQEQQKQLKDQVAALKSEVKEKDTLLKEKEQIIHDKEKTIQRSERLSSKANLHLETEQGQVSGLISLFQDITRKLPDSNQVLQMSNNGQQIRNHPPYVEPVRNQQPNGEARLEATNKEKTANNLSATVQKHIHEAKVFETSTKKSNISTSKSASRDQNSDSDESDISKRLDASSETDKDRTDGATNSANDSLLEGAKADSTRKLETKHKEKLEAHPTKRKQEEKLCKAHVSSSKVEPKTNSKTKVIESAETEHKPTTSPSKGTAELANSEERNSSSENGSKVQKLKNHKPDGKHCSSEHEYDEKLGTPV